jgi:hypothetical protein
VSAFADPENIRLATEEFVPVTGDDWYQRRRQDAEGAFFRKVADQGPRKGEGGGTRQGIYCLTADGELLAYKNAGQDAAVMREVFQQALKARNRLPAWRNRPGAVTVGDHGPVDRNFVRTPPEGGTIIEVSTRILDRDGQGDPCRGHCSTIGGDRAARDHLWLTAQEVRKLVPARPAADVQYPVPAAVAERIVRFHLVDNTRGEPPHWAREQVRRQDLALTVESVTPERVTLRLDGSALLSESADPARSLRGFDVKLHGRLEFDRVAERLTRFDVVAAGDHWGSGTYTGNARPGKSLLGVAFELSKGDRPGDRVPPQAAREVAAYLGTGR